MPKADDVQKKRRTSEEFLKTHESLWREGPKVKYSNPDAWVNYEPGKENPSENRRYIPSA